MGVAGGKAVTALTPRGLRANLCEQDAARPPAPTKSLAVCGAFVYRGAVMRAIYIDESASPDGSEYYLAGLVVDAPALRHIERDMDRLVSDMARQSPGLPPDAEVHAYDVFHGKGEWAEVPVWMRVRVCTVVARIIRRSGARLVFRGVDIDALERRHAHPHPPHELVLAQLLCDIDARLGPEGALGDVGICHADEHHTADSGRRNLRQFKLSRVPGFTDRIIENIGDTIFFGPSHASRLLQAVDVATFFLNRDRNRVEGDERAAKAVERIVGDLREVTVREYDWVP